MKTSTSSKIVRVAKAFVTVGANLGIFVLTLTSITSLVLLLAKGTEMTFSAYDAFWGSSAFVLTFVTGNTLMIYGLIQLKQFVKNFNEGDLFADKTISFLKKEAVLMALVGAIQGLTEFIINPAHIILNISIASWLLIASFILSYIKKHFAKKVV